MAPVRSLEQRLGAWQQVGTPHYVSLAAALARLVQEGTLPPGTRLPAERTLAASLGVSRGTVKGALESLRERDLVRTRQGSGTIVTGSGSPLTNAREAHVAAALDPHSIYRGVLALGGDTIDMRAAHWEGTDHLPRDAFVLPDHALDDLRSGHGYHPLGLPALRAAIAAHLSATGLPSSAEQILVTSGAQQALALVAQLLLGPEDTAVVEALTYPGAADVVIAQQARLATAPMGAGGADPDGLAQVVAAVRPAAVFLVGGIHNPTGLAPSSASREAIATAASRWDTVVVEDRTLAETAFDGAIRPAVAAFADPDGPATVLTVGSLSKLAWGGLRVGWLRGPGPMLARLARLKAINDLGGSAISQALAVRLLADANRLRAARREQLRERFELFTGMLSAKLGDWRWLRPHGGMCVWVDIGTDSAAYAPFAEARGVGVAPGRISAPGGGGGRHLRLPYGRDSAVLDDATDRLAAAWSDFQRAPRRPDDVGVVV